MLEASAPGATAEGYLLDGPAPDHLPTRPQIASPRGTDCVLPATNNTAEESNGVEGEHATMEEPHNAVAAPTSPLPTIQDEPFRSDVTGAVEGSEDVADEHAVVAAQASSPALPHASVSTTARSGIPTKEYPRKTAYGEGEGGQRERESESVSNSASNTGRSHR